MGEQAAAIQEALNNGGAFIDTGPEVLKGLQQGNIDPYLIYEQALKNQIDAKISRIDFVGANIDDQIQIWNGKLENLTPIHVRLAQWLKVNAKTYRYEQGGNSWVLKK